MSNTNLTEERRSLLLETKKGLETLLKIINGILSGKTSQTEVAKKLGLNPQSFSHCVKTLFMGKLHKLPCLTESGFREMLKDAMTPYEHLMCDILGIDVLTSKQILVLPYEDEEFLQKLIQERLNEQEQNVIIQYYGLDGKDPITKTEIARQLNLTNNRITQICAKALRKLRCPACYEKLCPKDLITNYCDLKHSPIVEYQTKRLEAHQFNCIDIDRLHLSVRSYNGLKRAGIDTINKLLVRTPGQLERVRNLGKRSVEEIQSALSTLGLSLMSEDELELQSQNTLAENEFYTIPVQWGVFSTISVEAESRDQAIEIAQNQIKNLPLCSDPEYIKNSYQITIDVMEPNVKYEHIGDVTIKNDRFGIRILKGDKGIYEPRE